MERLEDDDPHRPHVRLEAVLLAYGVRVRARGRVRVRGRGTVRGRGRARGRGMGRFRVRVRGSGRVIGLEPHSSPKRRSGLMYWMVPHLGVRVKG